MRLHRFMCVAAALSGLLATVPGVARAQYFQGFESNTSGWNLNPSDPGVPGPTNNATRVASGTNGITSYQGSFHAEAAFAPNPGGPGPGNGSAFTRFGGASGTFPAGGFTTSVAVYLNMSGGWANDTRFDWDVAAANTSGFFARDFAFNVGFYNNGTLGGSGNRFIMSASNNANRGSSFPANPGRDPFTVSASGWYLFEHNFHDNGSGVLAVTLNLRSASGVLLHSWTLSDPSDIIGTTIGGWRYGWFVQNEFSVLAFDSSARDSAATATVSLTAAACSSSSTVDVPIVLTSSNYSIVGGQFFMTYDTDALTYTGATPGPGFSSTPLCNTFNPTFTGSTGSIDFCVGLPSPFSPAVSAGATMATLHFTRAANVCTSASRNLVRFDRNGPFGIPNAVSRAGNDPTVATTFVNLVPVTLDNTPPSLICAADISVTSDANSPCASASAARAVTPGWHTSGDVALEDDARPGNDLALKMDSRPPAPPYHVSTLSYTFPVAPLFPSLTTLSSDFKVLSGTFDGGAPRFTVYLDNNNDGVVDTALDAFWGNPHVPPPSYTDGAWHATGNLASNPFDVRGQGGYLYQVPRASLDVSFATSRILAVSLQVDAGYSSNQQFVMDNVNIGGNVQRFNPEYSDNCDVILTGVRSDSAALTAPYTAPTTTITWTATDCASNTVQCNQTVTRTSTNTVQVSVQLAGVVSSPTFSRCITFDLYTAGCPGAPAATATATLLFNGGYGSGSIEVPCNTYASITARDRFHTLRRTADDNADPDQDHFGLTRSVLNTFSWDDSSLGVPGGSYYASFINDISGGLGSDDSLKGGNLDDNYYVDILDFGIFVGQWMSSASPNTGCVPTIATRNADSTGDGLVDIDDYTFISSNFLTANEADQCGAFSLIGPIANQPGGPVTDISIFDLAAFDWENARVADINRDGRVDMNDVYFVMQHGLSRCPADFNDRDGVSIDDIFSYINSWFGRHPACDVDDNQRVDIDDLFGFINIWFQGCN